MLKESQPEISKDISAEISAETATRLSPAERRGLVRCAIRGADGNPLQLSVPIEGGASAVKNHDPESWRISLHGNWPRVHWGAIATAYASAPFFPHFEEELHGIISDPPATAAELCEATAEWTLRALSIEEILPDLSRLIASNPEKAEALRRDALGCDNTGHVEPDLSIVDAVMRLGPQAIFALIPPFNLKSK